MRGLVGLVLVVALGVLPGCAMTRVSQAVGVEFPIERLPEIRPGMPEADVIRMLGTPYARGTDGDGTPFLRYEYLVTTARSIGAGLGNISVTGSQETSGAKARIILDPAGTVKAVQYEVHGSERYDQVRGGSRAQGH